MKAPDGFELMYAEPWSQEVHLVPDERRTQGGSGESLCDLLLEYGTGTWDERDNAERLPVCPRCAVLGPVTR